MTTMYCTNCGSKLNSLKTCEGDIRIVLKNLELASADFDSHTGKRWYRIESSARCNKCSNSLDLTEWDSERNESWPDSRLLDRYIGKGRWKYKYEYYHFGDLSVLDSHFQDGKYPSLRKCRKTYCPKCGHPAIGTSFCFIATAVYGSADHPNIAKLRQFRDSLLMTTVVGAWLIRKYYAVSPTIARYLNRSPVSNFIVRRCIIDPLVIFIRWLN